MSSLSRIAVVGEALVDVLRDGNRVEERPGGSPANVAVGLARLGADVRFVTTLGDDAAGHTVRRWLVGGGVDLVVDRDPGGTSVAIGTVAADGVTSYTFDLRWPLTASAVTTLLEEPPDYLHVGSLGALVEPGATSVLRLLEAVPEAVVVTYDPNVRLAIVDAAAVRDRVEQLVARADVVKASDDDLRALYADDAPLAAARRWSERGTPLVVVTHGVAGATAITAGFEVSVPAVPVEVVDTVGAGDTFMAMLLVRLCEHGKARDWSRDDLEQVLHDCAAAAAVTCTRRGADPPDHAAL